MKILTEEQLAEVDRIIEETEIATSYFFDGESSVEVDDAEGSLRSAARRVREYLSTLETKDTEVRR